MHFLFKKGGVTVRVRRVAARVEIFYLVARGRRGGAAHPRKRAKFMKLQLNN
jgi:hypothetical protein